MPRVERECAECGSTFRGETRLCSGCQARERECASCGNTFSGRYRKCPDCRNAPGICQFPGCGQPKVPGRGSKLCQEHRDTAYPRKVAALRTATCSMPGCGEPKFTGTTETGRARPYRYCEKHRAEAPLRERRRALQRSRERQYGITNDEYLAMLDAQGDACAICGSGNEKRTLSVDHDHVTGAVRALLCDRCNPMLGYAQDNVIVLLRAAEYLLQFAGKGELHIRPIHGPSRIPGTLN